MGYEVTLADGTVEWVEGADSFTLEGPLTTFFVAGNRRSAIDSWSIKVASYRTDRVARIRRVAPETRESMHEVRTFANAS